ncbi:cystinosin homolog [Dendrobium catenatum]|uniref:Cystinosin like n=1 Tax=Dendrobium catenatum TaxID=906689 RepID=A0A2I0W8F7_9ASPA|nr:cystinosin homolog [Dendrobium catenatum]PKU71947.1 Cystinosin like [Dendrobium catenatum]
MIPVAANDVAFSIHAVLLTVFTLLQVLIYDRGNQNVSKSCILISSATWAAALVCLIVAWPKLSWLWLISVFNTIQVVMTAIKYIPQAFMNFKRKSTVGWSIGNILLDLTGGLLNFVQMAVQSVDQNTWVNFYGNIGKTLLSLVYFLFNGFLSPCKRITTVFQIH